VVRASSRCRPGGRLTGPDPSRFQADHRRWYLVRPFVLSALFFFTRKLGSLNIFLHIVGIVATLNQHGTVWWASLRKNRI
jgi:hypothetical protein